MHQYHRYTVVALALLAGTGAASAQMPLTRNAVDTIAIEAPQQVRAQRTMSYRTRSSRALRLYKYVPMTSRRGITQTH
jgi:hypothetical protein